MTPDRWQKVCAVFDEVNGLAPAARSRCLDEACAGDPEVRAEVERLLAAEPLAAEGLFLAALGTATATSAPTKPEGDPSKDGPLGNRQTIGRYRLVRRLGQGSFGWVYLAHDDSLKRPVAIKVSSPERLLTPEDIELYLEEAQILAQLEHINIVPVYDLGRTEDGLCYIVSKFIDGTDLAKRLQQGRPSFRESAELIATIAEATHYAHTHGVVHRDIKPANILLDQSGKAYVADFGLALKDEDFGKGPRTAGTPSYMSPEQARGEGHLVNGCSDIFSLGIVFYEMLTGRRPFWGESHRDIMKQIVRAEPQPPRQIDDTIPREQERICLKALAKRAADRYTTARDLADDLRHFLQVAKLTDMSMSAAPLAGTPPASTQEANPARNAPGTPEPDPRTVRIVPKGLRSFDEHDADFFLDLLPGPRDREGLPEALRFWKTRIEAADPDKTFRVGMIYGPSGCGKSSLIKAGLLPCLTKPVLSVYVEATASETESRLLRGVRKICPNLPEYLDLTSSFAALRRGHFLRPAQKVVFVLDQFEQWLFEWHAEEETDLLAALRQCDGEHTQAIILVRDDFWMAATRLMNELEVDLVSDRNLAAVDLFDQGHARKVLADFGRAYNTLPQTGKLQRDQEAFLDQAVAGLTQGGKVVPVCLALFADMIKGKPWTPATLAEVGGAEGVGKRFLQEMFESNVNPRCRRHREAAQAVLKALLPERFTDIRGPMRSEADLREAAGYSERPLQFDDLIYILASELRLVTPVEHDGLTAERPSAGSAGGRFYQLTHDYLIHSLRDWLDDKKKETWRGRAELLLADRAALWSVRHESRHLPSWPEYLYLLLGTRRGSRSTAQQALMRSAGRRASAHVSPCWPHACSASLPGPGTIYMSETPVGSPFGSWRHRPPGSRPSSTRWPRSVAGSIRSCDAKPAGHSTPAIADCSM